MIAIVNISRPPTRTGPNTYEIRINQNPISRFQHNREDSLAVLLRKAAEEAEFIEQEAKIRWLDQAAREEENPT
jgi:hypothetical protein